MAIFATRRKWEVTSLCAASISCWSRHRWESDSSFSGVSIGNFLISWRYRVRLPSGAMFRTADAIEGSIVAVRPCPTWRTHDGGDYSVKLDAREEFRPGHPPLVGGGVSGPSPSRDASLASTPSLYRTIMVLSRLLTS